MNRSRRGQALSPQHVGPVVEVPREGLLYRSLERASIEAPRRFLWAHAPSKPRGTVACAQWHGQALSFSEESLFLLDGAALDTSRQGAVPFRRRNAASMARSADRYRARDHDDL